MKRQLLAVVLNRVTLLPGNGFDELPFMSERQPKLQDLISEGLQSELSHRSQGLPSAKRKPHSTRGGSPRNPKSVPPDQKSYPVHTWIKKQPSPPRVLLPHRLGEADFSIHADVCPPSLTGGSKERTKAALTITAVLAAMLRLSEAFCSSGSAPPVSLQGFACTKPKPCLVNADNHCSFSLL